MEALIIRHGACPTVVASMQEIPFDENPAALRFVRSLREGHVDVVVFLTGVGARALRTAIGVECSDDEFVSLLGRCTIVTRGPKPGIVLGKWGLRPDAQAAEPNTWREVVTALSGLEAIAGQTIAVQEYGIANAEFYQELRDGGARVLPVPVYRWCLPDDTGPLESGIRRTVDGGFDVLLFTSANQLSNVLEIAERLGLAAEWRQAAKQCVIGSVGPMASDAVREAGLQVDVEPKKPKMGPLVRETLAEAISRIQPP
ncbi:MAG: uroporphyrinogen-III synthase [Planctomycetaceae bacterium]